MLIKCYMWRSIQLNDVCTLYECLLYENSQWGISTQTLLFTLWIQIIERKAFSYFLVCFLLVGWGTEGGRVIWQSRQHFSWVVFAFFWGGRSKFCSQERMRNFPIGINRNCENSCPTEDFKGADCKVGSECTQVHRLYIHWMQHSYTPNVCCK